MPNHLTQVLQYDAGVIALESAHNYDPQRLTPLVSTCPLEAAWLAARSIYCYTVLDVAAPRYSNAVVTIDAASDESATAHTAAQNFVCVETRYLHAVQAYYSRQGITQSSAKECGGAFWDAHWTVQGEIFELIQCGCSDAVPRLLDFYWGLKTDSEWYGFFITLADRLDRSELLFLAPYVRRSMQAYYKRALFIRVSLDYPTANPEV